MTATDSRVHEVPEDAELVSVLDSMSGYMELGMLEEAHAELERVPLEHRDLPAVLHLELIVLMALRRYQEAADTAKWAVDEHRDVMEFYIHGVAALCSNDDQSGARELWQSAPTMMKENGDFHFNLAWCELKLGDVSQARDHLEEAIKLNPEFEQQAAKDPQLQLILSDPCQLN